MTSNVFLGKVLEYIVKNIYKKRGYLTFRMAGSRPVDLLIIYKNQTIYIIYYYDKSNLYGIKEYLKDQYYVILQQAGHEEYIAIKNKVIILIMSKDHPDIRVLEEAKQLNIKLVEVSNPKKISISKKKYLCEKFGIVEVKMQPIIIKDQFTRQVEIERCTGARHLYVMKSGGNLYEYFFSHGQKMVVSHFYPKNRSK